MKKLLISLICLLSFSFFTVGAVSLPEKTDHEKVTINIFRGSGCSHCYEALEFFNANYAKYSEYIDIRVYETWKDSTNADLFNAVATELGDEAGGVPYIVVGESYHQAGFLSSLGEDIIQAALDEYENAEYRDVVAEVASEMESHPTTLADACEEEGIIAEDYDTTEDEKEGNDAIVIIAIFTVVIGGFVALMICSRKK